MASPRRALDASDQPGAAGRAPGDLALLILAVFAAANVETLVRGAWLIGAGEVGAGFQVVASRLGAVLASPLIALLAGVAVVFAAAGRKRQLGADSDLACVAFTPAVVVALGGELIAAIAGPVAFLGLAVRGVALLWYAAMLALAVTQARYYRIASEADAREPWRSSPRARIAGLAAVAAVVALLVIGGVRVGADLERYRPTVSGDRAPAFALPAIEAGGALGPEVALADYEGKVVILDFWATWCRPCRTSMPLLEQLVGRLDGVELVSINIEGPGKRELARQMVDRLAPSAVLVSDVAGADEAYGVSTIPHLVLIDQRGVVRHVHRGGLVPSVRDELGERITALLEAEL